MYVPGWILAAPKIAAVAASTAALLAGPAGASAGLIHSRVPASRKIMSPAAKYHYSPLVGVAAAPGGRAWAVGLSTNGISQHPLIEQWNGSAWRVVPSPNPGALSSNQNALNGVADTSATNAWAVGSYTNGLADFTLIDHWNGAKWLQTPSPSPGVGITSTNLYGVEATSAFNAWAVGYYSANGSYLTLTEHWNGSTWIHVPSPNPAGAAASFLTGVAATSPDNAWAVGYSGTGSKNKTLIEHWNGRSWTIVPSPSPGPHGGQNILNSVAMTSATSAWAVGYDGNVITIADRTLILHWNGTQWKQVASVSPAGGAGVSQLYGVAADAAGKAWAVGLYFNRTRTVGGTLTERWNGSAWLRVASPSPGAPAGSALYAVALTSPVRAWATGNYTRAANIYLSLAERWNGTTWRQVPSPS